jgi:hypothetical protein
MFFRSVVLAFSVGAAGVASTEAAVLRLYMSPSGADELCGTKVADGARTELRFRYLRVQNYATAMVFHGNREDEQSGWNGGNHLYGMYFYRIGGLYSWRQTSTAAVDLSNSRDNYIAHYHFVNIENHYEDAGQLHAIYVAHHSNGNLITRNHFANVNGETVRVRDASNYNRILANTFFRTSRKAYYSEWFCEGERCTKSTPECPSMANEFRDNQLYGGYYHSWSRPWPNHPALSKLYGPANACGPLAAPRLYTSGNVFH